MRAIICCLILASISSYAQRKIKTLEVSDTILFAAVDRPGELYVITRHGQMQKFDENGKLLVLIKHQAPPTLFDPRDGARLFAYYRDKQLYEYLSPTFEPVASYHVDSAFVIQPWLICPSGDHKLWVLDVADNSLKRINVSESQVEVEVLIDSSRIDAVQRFTTMREYQGFVFLLDPAKGIFIFNALGKHIKTVATSGVRHFNFLGEELYFREDDMIRFFDLFSAETREIKSGDPNAEAIITDRRMYIIKSVSIDILTF